MTEEVGYGRPPKQYRFKKGQSGNPNGRPRRRPEDTDLGAIFRKVANETIAVSGGNGPIDMPRWEALFRQLMMLALGNKPHLATLLLQIREAFGPISSPPTFLIRESDSKL